MSTVSPWRGYPRQLPGGHLSGSQPPNPSFSWRWQELTRLMDTGDWGHYPETRQIEGEVTLTWICPSFNNNSGALSIDIGTKGLFWPSYDISSSSLCCMGCWEYLGLDRAGVQDLIISGQVWERSWCWRIRSLPLCRRPMGCEDRREGAWLFL